MEYSKLIITNLPAFYKINLFNEINKKVKILVIFTDDGAGIRNDSFYKNDINFEFINLKKYGFFKKKIIVIRILFKEQFSEIVIGGWDSTIYWLCAFLSPTKKNSIIVESSYLESNSAGLKGILKKIFIQRISKVYVSGKSQKKLLEAIGFKKKVVITKGVGIFNIVPKQNFEPISTIENFLYVGRFSHEKNLTHLIEVFNSMPEFKLNLIGYGPQEDALRLIAGSNINFLGSILNQDLPDHYKSNDVFILPSLIEPWGLVVEEAFNNGLPVLVSNKVGCAEEIVQNNINGVIFELNEENALKDAIVRISNVDFYNRLKKNVSLMDFNDIAERQVNCYI